MIKYKNSFSEINIYLYAAASVLVSTACLFFFVARVNAAQDGAEYMFILKNGSNITAAADEESLSDDKIKIVKIRTSYGELEIPRDEIIKYYKSPADEPAGEKIGGKTEEKNEGKKYTENKAVEKEARPADAKAESEEAITPEAPEKTQAEKTLPAVKTEKTTETAKNEIENETLKIEEIEDDENKIHENKENAAAIPPKSAGADDLLNLDDDKLLDMLGESDIEPPKPVIATDTEKIGEIEEIRSKYQAKNEGNKKLIPDNLNSIEADIKSMAESSTEEDWLIAKFTREIQVETAETVPVEIIEVGVKNSDNDRKNDTSASSKDGTKEAGISKKSGGATLEVILSETEEARIIGGGKLSEKIVKEFKKHKALPHKKISEKQHLNAEIQKHFGPGEDKKPAAETKEVKIEKK